MRIVLSAAFNVYASVGITKYLQRLAHALQDRCELTIMTPDPRGFPSKASIVPIPPWTARSYGRLFWMVTSLRRLVPRQPGAVLLCPTPDTPPNPPIPTISVVHDLIPVLLPKHTRLSDRVLFRASLETLRWADRVLAVSDNTARDLARVLPWVKNRVSVCHNGPGITPVTETPGLAAGLRPYVLYVGGYSPHKNLTRMVSAFGALSDTPDLKLVLVGGEHHRGIDELLVLVRKLGIADRVTLLKNISDDRVSELYRSAEFLIYPSLYEGFGLPVLESLVHGTPVVCSRAASLPEVAGPLAVYFNPYDSRDIIQAIRYALTHRDALAERIRRNGKQLADFSWSTAATSILSTARGLLDAPPTRRT